MYPTALVILVIFCSLFVHLSKSIYCTRYCQLCIYCLEAYFKVERAHVFSLAQLTVKQPKSKIGRPTLNRISQQPIPKYFKECVQCGKENLVSLKHNLGLVFT